MSKENKKEYIDLDLETQGNLKELVRNLNEIQARLNIIARTYIKAKDKEGDYIISKDFTRLEKTKKDK